MMKRLTLSLLFLLILKLSPAQPVVTACTLAQPLTQTVNYCSANGQYSNSNPHKSTWFEFIATGYDVNIIISGAGAGGTLTAPQVQLYSDCIGTELVGTGLSANNITSLYKGGLIIGNTYYIQVTGTNSATGTFSLCLNNYDPIIKPGQDCSTSSFLCSTQTISQQNVIGAGSNNDEAKGTCLSTTGQVSESNSVWYKWQAANNGTLVFTITPTSVKDDIDWVLFDLGTSGDCSAVIPANAIRCKAGYGVANIDCPNDVVYYKTGLDFNETDFTEPPGCGQGQNGKLKFLTMQQGHIYGLLINNFSSGNNGFTLAFTDQQDKAGDGAFTGPVPVIAYTGQNTCTPNQPYTFTSNSTNYASLKWSFGNGASVQNATTPGPHVVTYSTPGIKTVTLEATASGGCTVVATQQLTVGEKPPLPQISPDKTTYCVGDTVKLQTPAMPNTTYSWTGPGNFQSDSSTAVIPVMGNQVAGTYKLVVSSFGCSSDAAQIILPMPLTSPIAAFHTNPASVNAPYGPVTLQFINDTMNAGSFFWDFGDGSTSTAQNPVHTYDGKGQFDVKLTASRANSCHNSTIQYGLAIIQNNNYIFIPNIFTPNGDNINDLFNVTITNIKSYMIRIYNRWGQLLFTSANIHNSWDGTYSGKPAPFGVYYYVIDATGTDNAALKRSGYVTIIR